MNILINGVTGGIGAALVNTLRQRLPEATVLTAARRPTDEATLALDLTDERSIAAAAQRVGQQVDRLHWLINAAGVLHGVDLQPEKRLEQFDADSALQVMAINAVGPLLLAKHFLPLLNHDQPAKFASIAARVGSIGDNRLGGWYSYRASKAALVMLIKTLSIETARRAKNVTCVCLHPGTVDTGLSAPFQANVPRKQLFTSAQSAGYLFDVLTQVGPERHGRHVAWDGQVVDW